MQLSQQENSNVKGEQFNKIDPIGFGCRSRPCDTVSACIRLVALYIMMLGSAIQMADELQFIIDSKFTEAEDDEGDSGTFRFRES